jgi:hypothetical protein
MFNIALKKLFVALGYDESEVSSGITDEAFIKIIEPVSKNQWVWLSVVVLAPVVSPFILKGREKLDGMFKSKAVQ